MVAIDTATQVWNRACRDLGAGAVLPGDRALGALILFDSLANNGGVHHAISCLDASERDAAVQGFEYFGLRHVAELLRDCMHDFDEDAWSDDQITAADEKYWSLEPDRLVDEAFARVYRLHAEAFAPVTTSVDDAA